MKFFLLLILLPIVGAELVNLDVPTTSNLGQLFSLNELLFIVGNYKTVDFNNVPTGEVFIFNTTSNTYTLDDYKINLLNIQSYLTIPELNAIFFGGGYYQTTEEIVYTRLINIYINGRWKSTDFTNECQGMVSFFQRENTIIFYCMVNPNNNNNVYVRQLDLLYFNSSDFTQTNFQTYSYTNAFVSFYVKETQKNYITYGEDLWEIKSDKLSLSIIESQNPYLKNFLGQIVYLKNYLYFFTNCLQTNYQDKLIKMSMIDGTIDFLYTSNNRNPINMLYLNGYMVLLFPEKIIFVNISTKESNTIILQSNGVGSANAKSGLAFIIANNKLHAFGDCDFSYYKEVNPTMCVKVSAGYYSNFSVVPEICPTGYYCPSTSNIPVMCPRGTYSEKVGLATSEECTLCPSGTFNFEDTNDCHQCAQQYFCPNGSVFPQPCPKNHYCPTPQNAFNCPSGQYNPTEFSTSANDCINCPIGYFCLAGESPQVCPAGSYSNKEGMKDCIVCPEGYQCLLGKTEPIICPKNSFSTSGSSICNKCGINQFTLKEGATECENCPISKWSLDGWFCMTFEQKFVFIIAWVITICSAILTITKTYSLLKERMQYLKKKNKKRNLWNIMFYREKPFPFKPIFRRKKKDYLLSDYP